jgi:hypothetical protein
MAYFYFTDGVIRSQRRGWRTYEWQKKMRKVVRVKRGIPHQRLENQVMPLNQEEAIEEEGGDKVPGGKAGRMLFEIVCGGGYHDKSRWDEF